MATCQEGVTDVLLLEPEIPDDAKRYYREEGNEEVGKGCPRSFLQEMQESPPVEAAIVDQVRKDREAEKRRMVPIQLLPRMGLLLLTRKRKVNLVWNLSRGRFCGISSQATMTGLLNITSVRKAC